MDSEEQWWNGEAKERMGERLRPHPARLLQEQDAQKENAKR